MYVCMYVCMYVYQLRDVSGGLLRGLFAGRSRDHWTPERALGAPRIQTLTVCNLT